MTEAEVTARGRALPAARPGSRRHRLRLALIGACLLPVALVAAVITTGVMNARAMPIERQLVLRVPGLAAGTAPIRLAVLSDIHLGLSDEALSRLETIVDRVNSTKPDLVLLAGDFMVGHTAAGASELAARLSGPLGRLRATQGVFAVPGNHDHWTDLGVVRTALARAGIVTLENQAIRRGPLAIVGIDDRFSGHDDIRRSLADARRVGGVPIVLTHSPDIVPDLPADLPLVLAGHTHCGQIVLPWIGAIANHSPVLNWRRIYDPRYRCGKVLDGDRTTLVTAGIGAGFPLRIGAMPDWWQVTLQP